MSAEIHRLDTTHKSDKFKIVLQDLMQLLEREKSHLQSGSVEMLETFAREKMQMFVSLNRLAQTAAIGTYSEEDRAEVINVNKMLTENLSSLKFRMDAISEITKTIEDSISDSESDGTYVASSYAGI